MGTTDRTARTAGWAPGTVRVGATTFDAIMRAMVVPQANLATLVEER